MAGDRERRGRRRGYYPSYGSYATMGVDTLQRHREAISEVLAGTRRERGDSRKLRWYEGSRKSALRKRLRAIEGVQGRRARNVPWEEFDRFHDKGDCEVEMVYLRTEGSGFVDVDFLVENPLYFFIKKCRTHGGTSEEAGFLSWPKGVAMPDRR